MTWNHFSLSNLNKAIHFSISSSNHNVYIYYLFKRILFCSTTCLCVPCAESDTKKERVKSLFASDSQKSDSNELLDLCSGQFSGNSDPSVWAVASKSRGSIYNRELSATDSNSLLDVLSGKFTDTQQPAVHLSRSEQLIVMVLIVMVSISYRLHVLLSVQCTFWLLVFAVGFFNLLNRNCKVDEC